MKDKKLLLRIITPRGKKVEQKADMLVMRCVGGDVGILPNHMPLSSPISDGILRIINGKEEQKMALFGGVVEVKNNIVTILTSIAQRPEEIDLARAEHDRKQYEQLMQERSSDLKMQSYSVLLRRALVRIEVSSEPIISGSDIDESDDI
ncbi:MAG: ATP synthase F1 subunit epsilon [Clostridiales bacterium]|nr:ATP synthase F1 subunit epsilon [Clostridiales bacterium]